MEEIKKPLMNAKKENKNKQVKGIFQDLKMEIQSIKKT